GGGAGPRLVLPAPPAGGAPPPAPLGLTQRAPPADCDQAVAPLGAIEASPGVDQLDAGVSPHLRIHDRLEVARAKPAGGLVQQPRAHDPPVRDHPWSCDAHAPRLLPQRPEPAPAPGHAKPRLV